MTVIYHGTKTLNFEGNWDLEFVTL